LVPVLQRVVVALEKVMRLQALLQLPKGQLTLGLLIRAAVLIGLNVS
jgi:hypothetical protein